VALVSFELVHFGHTTDFHFSGMLSLAKDFLSFPFSSGLDHLVA